MTDLENEFQLLVEEIYKTIRAKQVEGDYTRQEADDLTRMVEDRLDNISYNSWDSSDCSI